MSSKIVVPTMGDKITVNADYSLNVPTARSFPTLRATAPASTSLRS